LPVMAREKWLGEQAPTALRMRQIQLLLGHETDTAFARDLGISLSRLNNLFHGAPIGKDLAFRLVGRVPGLTLDWIWFGKTDGLSVHLARSLESPTARPGKPRTRF
jgi:hypothetical protein